MGYNGEKRRYMRKDRIVEVVVKGAGAAFLIGLGDYALLKVGNPIGPVLFSFGLLSVCVLGANLFTGKCGFLFEDKIKVCELVLILVVNLIFGYLFGAMFAMADGEVMMAAVAKVEGWGVSWAYFLRAVLCGAIMYYAVKLYRKGTKLGVLIGVPLFIFSGMQHSIANVITFGATLEFSLSVCLFVLICVAGNFLGAILAWFLTGDLVSRGEKKSGEEEKEETAKGRKLKVGGVYRHFKGDEYLVEDLGYDSETKEKMVVYRGLYEEGKVWCRPLEMFMSEVDHKKYPKVKQKYRFELVERESKNAG